MKPAPSIMWFRRDLRLGDNPALLAAADQGPVLALFVLDPALIRPSGAPRQTFLFRTLRVLDQQLRERGGGLTIRAGNPTEVVPQLAKETGARTVHIAADFGPYGATRDLAVKRVMDEDGIALIRTGSPYAVSPGRIRNAAGEPYRVFTPFYRAWRRHGWRRPAPPPPADTQWATCPSLPIPTDGTDTATARPVLLDAGEPAAHSRWIQFRHDRLALYSEHRNYPATQGTSRLSVDLKFGTMHPRTLLADLKSEDDAFARQLAWREFYATVLHFWPDSARSSFLPRMATMMWATGPQADQHFSSWQQGRTGYPLVDAGMRQLAATGWMHNRVRMVAASFLVKDLHIAWPRGARHFMRHLVDGDLANNQHGWQWAAGTGTDAAPYYRVLNPITQSRRFDLAGDYIRQWIPELEGLTTPHIHAPWESPGGPPNGYPAPIVDHTIERQVALDMYRATSDDV